MSTSVIFSVNFNANVKFNPSKINFILTINRDVKIAPTIEEDKCPGDLILESTTTTTQSLFLSAERAKRPLDNADKIKEENCCCSRLSIVSMVSIIYLFKLNIIQANVAFYFILGHVYYILLDRHSYRVRPTR